MKFVGFTSLGSTIYPTFATVNSSDTPVNADSFPTYRVYGPNGIMTNATGSFALRDTGSIADASNNSPIVVTSVNHKLSTGTRVTIAGVNGNTAANTTVQITVQNSNSFSLNGTSGSGAYSGGGTWNVTGLYYVAFTPTAANGFEAGQSYVMFVTYAVSGVTKSEFFVFTVV